MKRLLTFTFAATLLLASCKKCHTIVYRVERTYTLHTSPNEPYTIVTKTEHEVCDMTTRKAREYAASVDERITYASDTLIIAEHTTATLQ
jgi:hypothetical protein